MSKVDITPAGPTFAIWGLIYTWQLAWLIFNIIIVFLTTNPLILNSSFEILIFSNFILNITWIFLFNNKLLTVSLNLFIYINIKFLTLNE